MFPPYDDGSDVPRLPEDDAESIRKSPTGHVLPELVVMTLQKHFYAGVKHAEVRFQYHAADEDSVTGALANDLLEPEPMKIQVGGQVYLWTTTYYKIRGRGKDAPEGELGSDGIFQFEVYDERIGRMLVRKGLLFQSKKRWTGSDRRLLGQARDLLAQSPSAIVIDYSEKGYRAFAASDVVAANGNRRRIKARHNKPLAEVLGDEFVRCTRGDRGLRWEPEEERLIVGGERESEFIPQHFIGNKIERLQ